MICIYMNLYSKNIPLKGRILFGSTPLDLIEEYTSWSGRMISAPEWAMTGGLIAGLQGGTEKVRDYVDKLLDNDVPVVGLWLQDWTGKRETSFGRRLWWNWEVDEARALFTGLRLWEANLPENVGGLAPTDFMLSKKFLELFEG